MCILIVVLIILIIAKKEKSSVLWSQLFLWFVLPMFSAFFFSLNIYEDHNRPVILDPSEQISIENSWKIDVLQAQYLDNLPREKFYVMDFTLKAQKGVSVVLNVDKPIAIIDNIRDIKYLDIEKPYVQSSWVEGLSEIGYSNNFFYNTTLYLPKEEYEMK